MDTPESMKAELAAWNNGAGIDIESWVGCEGKFSLAVGYSSIFWPPFTLFEGYILREGFSEDSLRGFERNGRSRKSVEWLMNHLHIADIQYYGCSATAVQVAALPHECQKGRVDEELFVAVRLRCRSV